MEETLQTTEMAPQAGFTGWRKATRADLPVLLEHHRKREEQLGKPQDFPPVSDDPNSETLFAFPVMSAVVYEHDGKVIGCLYIETVPEAAMISSEPEFVRHALRAHSHYAGPLHRAGFPLLRVFVPKGVDMDDAFKATGQWICMDEHFRHYVTLTEGEGS